MKTLLSLLQTDTRKMPRNSFIMKYHWGSCAFIIAEAKHGRGIYREMMHSPQPYEVLIDMLGGRQ